MSKVVEIILGSSVSERQASGVVEVLLQNQLIARVKTGSCGQKQVKIGLECPVEASVMVAFHITCHIKLIFGKTISTSVTTDHRPSFGMYHIVL